jgi:hypothetical protein
MPFAPRSDACVLRLCSRSGGARTNRLRERCLGVSLKCYRFDGPGLVVELLALGARKVQPTASEVTPTAPEARPTAGWGARPCKPGPWIC